MADKPKSFEEFYYLMDDKVCDIDVVEEYVDNNGKIGKYEGNMFCPECREAILAFWRKTSKRRAHLKRIPSSKHSMQDILSQAGISMMAQANQMNQQVLSLLS